MAIYETTIEVWGDHAFPLDMLHYDTCVPHSHDDVAKIEASVTKGKNRKVIHNSPIRLRMLGAYCTPHPTPSRWRSFGWGVRVVNG